MNNLKLNYSSINSLLEALQNNSKLSLQYILVQILQLTQELNAQKIIHQGGFSGYIYTENNVSLGVYFAPLVGGDFLLKVANNTGEEFFLFNGNGDYLGKHQSLSPNILPLTFHDFHTSPLLNHIYNILSYEYTQAKLGLALSSNICLGENLLAEIFNHPSLAKLIYCAPEDEIFVVLANMYMQNAQDKVLTYTEQRIKQNLINSDYKIIYQTKQRAHAKFQKISSLLFLLNLFSIYFQIFFQQTRRNIKGLFVHLTCDPVTWFFSTVKNNIGYSIALAIYGPFTFYFITQPMNPYAMSAVGEVRKVYLDITSSAAALAKTITIKNTPAPIIAKIDLTTLYPPINPGMYLSTDFPSVSGQSWQSRMSNFKELQIGYESSLQFSARMGRLEQMETQLNFPLIAESSYRETERYIDLIQQTIRKNMQLSTPIFKEEFIKYLQAEEKRASELQLYIWDKLFRYMLDHPYTVMDESKAHNYVDYYTGRSFIFLRELTMHLHTKLSTFSPPAEFSKIEKLAEIYAEKYIPAPSIEERLRKNSRLGLQNDFYSSLELRNYVQRQWEILFLMQNKTQEAANFGLQMYVWSVRNALWVLESTYSTRRQELMLINNYLTNSDSAQRKLIQDEIQNRIEPLYESLFHILTLEFMSIRVDIDQNLKDDVEGAQRRIVIKNLQDFFVERELSFKSIFGKVWN